MIPEKYYRYTTERKLKFSHLLIKAIENEMYHDPDILQQKIKQLEENYETTKKQLLGNLEEAEKQKQKEEERKQQVQKEVRII